MSSIPLLYGVGIRVCSPVILRFGDGRTQRAVVVGTDDREPERRHGEWVVSAPKDWIDAEGSDYGEMSRSCKTADLALDLTDATGRLHATLFLAGLTSSGWYRWKGCWSNGGVTWGPPGTRGADVHIAALAELDADDPVQLPDGSLVVDAVALSIVLGDTAIVLQAIEAEIVRVKTGQAQAPAEETP